MALKQALSVTDAAAERIQALLAGRGKPSVGVRVGVRSRGCSGLSYTLEYADEQGKFDEVVEDKGVTILVDPKAVMFILGTEMDYVVERLAAAAAALLVRVAEDEARLQLVLDIVHLAAEDEQGRLGVDIDGDALVLDHLVVRLLGGRIFDRVGQAGAALALDPEAQAGGIRRALRQQLLDPRRGGVGEGDDGASNHDRPFLHS
jgi:iron-sulfur cluster assembly protein